MTGRRRKNILYATMALVSELEEDDLVRALWEPSVSGAHWLYLLKRSSQAHCQPGEARFGSESDEGAAPHSVLFLQGLGGIHSEKFRSVGTRQCARVWVGHTGFTC